ncbi:MAG: hypothetical protein JKY90_00870 [Gammaproteobacteria bacterium]|nr:hypothetical protein [Gammaproteobacteria bacterium]
MNAIKLIPADDPDTILPGGSPFQAYLRIRALCAGAISQVEIFDPWLDAQIYHLYVCEIGKEVAITVVTSKEIMEDNKYKTRRARIDAVSSLLAAERPDTYKFIVTSEQHDRHLRVDGKILHLGGSLKDASKKAPYTITGLGSTQSNNQFLDSVIELGDEWFGPSTNTHSTS